MAITAAAALAAGIGTAAGSAVKAKKARDKIKEEESMAEAQRVDNENIFKKQYYQDITDRTEVQDMLRQMREQQDIDRERTEAQAAIGGMTQEQKTALAGQRNKAYTDSAAKIAANASILKDGYLNNWQNNNNRYWATRMGLNDKVAGVYTNEANQLSTASSNLFNTATKIAGTTDW